MSQSPRQATRQAAGWADHLVLVTQIGLTMIGCILFCFWVGRVLDGWVGTRGVFATVFSVLGVFGGGNVAYRQILRPPAASREERSPNEMHR